MGTLAIISNVIGAGGSPEPYIPADYPALKYWNQCKKGATTEIVDATGKCPSTDVQGTLAPWTDPNALTFDARNTYANSFARIQTEDAGISDCYPGLTDVTLIHAYFKTDAVVTENSGIIYFGAGYTMGNSAGALNGAGFGMGISTNNTIIAWVRDGLQTTSPASYVSTELGISLPTPMNVDLDDGEFHSVQLMYVPNQSGRTGRECWVYGFYDGEWGNQPIPFELTTGIIPGTNPDRPGYDCHLFYHVRQSTPDTASGFKGVAKDLQVWKFTGGVPADIGLIIRDLHNNPRAQPARLKGRTI